MCIVPASTQPLGSQPLLWTVSAKEPDNTSTCGVAHCGECCVLAKVIVEELRVVGHEGEEKLGNAGLQQKVAAWKSPSNDMRRRALANDAPTVVTQEHPAFEPKTSQKE